MILGSYIGFRNSQKRGKFKLRFFNLAVLRFVLDQSMVFLYFWLGLYISLEQDSSGALEVPSATAFLRFDARVVLVVFLLYLSWDLVSQWMAHSGKYFVDKADPLSTPTRSDVRLEARTYRTLITLGATACATAILMISELAEPAGGAATAWIAALALLAVTYRVVKDGLQEKLP